jgi:MFS family permease
MRAERVLSIESLEHAEEFSMDHHGQGKAFDSIPFAPAKSPSLVGTALRAGEVPNIWSREYIGLLAQYAAIGIVYGGLPRTVYPFMNNYLHMDGYQTLSARVLLTIPWSCKLFMGIISDCFPMWRFRRRPYMVLGWLFCSSMLLVMVFMDQGKPFYLDSTFRGLDLSKMSSSELKGKINWNAPKTGASYIVLMMMASVGYMIADVSSDGLMVELAQREPEKTRGNIQSTVYMVRSLAMILAALLVGFGLNGVDYGGSFSWSMHISELMIIMVVSSVLAIPFAIFFIHEQAVSSQPSFQRYMISLWDLLQNRAMLQVMSYRFFSGVFDGFTITAGDPIQRYWAKVKPLNESIFSVIGLSVFTIALWFTKRHGLMWDWRRVIIVTVVVVILIDSIVSFLTIWDIVRNQWFWLGTPILEELPSAMNFLISAFVVVEMADLGNEAAVYGLLTTISNLSSPFASCLSKNVNGLFDVDVESIIRDDYTVRLHVTYTYIIAYVMKILSLGWLVLLPRQKAEVQQLKKNGGKSRVGGIICIIIASFALLWSIVTNLLSIFSSTACLKIAGGNGCK